MDAKHEKQIYGERPVFIFDDDDKSNRPVKGIHKGAITRWPFLPVYLQDAFKKAFGKEALTNPQSRITDQEWLRLFIRMRSEIYKCPCGEIYFADPVNINSCPNCKKQNSFSFVIKTHRYNIPVHQKTRLYACHTEKDSDDYQTLTGEISACTGASAGAGAFELKNLSTKNWTITDGENIIQSAPQDSFIATRRCKTARQAVLARLPRFK